MALNRQESLEILGINPSELAPLSDQEKLQRIKTRWRRLALQTHPDRTHHDTCEQFIRINEAYETLTSQSHSSSTRAGFRSELEELYQAVDVNYDDSTFDAEMEDAILEKYEALKNKFNTLESTSQKRRFASYYESFLNLATSIENKQARVNQQRTQALYNRINASPTKQYIARWRKMILSYFGKEYLEDFAYRQALASGNLMRVLSLRKILNPIKLTSALFQSIYLMLSVPINYYQTQLTLNLWFKFSRIYHEPNNILLKTAKLAGISLLTIAPLLLFCLGFYFVPTITLTLVITPLLSRSVKIIANPINTIARPLAKAFKIKPIIATSALSILSVGIIAGIIASALILPSLPIMPILSAINLVLSIVLVPNIIRICYKLFKVNKALGIFQAATALISLIVGSLIPSPYKDNDSSPLNIFNAIDAALLGLFINGSIYAGANKISDPNHNFATLMNELPLPRQAVPSHIKARVSLGQPCALISNRLFNSGKDSKVIPSNQRTFSHKIHSFFGGGQTKPDEPDFAQEDEIRPSLGI